jgi:hypothetical protein
MLPLPAMIYTVGLIDKYEAAIDAGRGLKLGPHTRRDGYADPGGWVWRTPEEARAYLALRGSLDTRRVYGVLADWDADTHEVAGEPTRCLKRDARVVRLG